MRHQRVVNPSPVGTVTVNACTCGEQHRLIEHFRWAGRILKLAAVRRRCHIRECQWCGW